MRTAKFTDDEIKAALQLIDLAVKAGGLNVAVAAITIAQRLQEAPQEPSPELPAAEPKSGEPA